MRPVVEGITRRGVFHELANLVPEVEPRLECSVLTYHEVSYINFKRDILSLLQRGYRPVSIENFVYALNALNRRATLPEHTQTFLVTFDDSLASQYTAGLKALDEIEKETGSFVAAVFFAITKFDDHVVPLFSVSDQTPAYNDRVHSYLTKGQLVSLIQRGHSIQNHTVNHPDLTRLSEGARNGEIVTAEERLDVLYNLAGRQKLCRVFAYPYGRFAGQPEVLKLLNFGAAFTTLAGTSHLRSDRFLLKRVART